ncbi:MAG: hypothetical protein JW798_01435 [Prolixibacteraceae bacterium]|nr:hypothetical protein [Prolixibacteraceae bacterium]
MKKRLILLAITIININSLFAQEEPEIIKYSKNNAPNIIYVDAGLGGYLFQAGLHYERVFFSKNGNDLSIKGAYGWHIIPFFPTIRDYYSLSVHYCYPVISIQLEAALGFSVFDHKTGMNPFQFENADFVPTGYLGIRLRNSTKRSIIKIGVGYPQIISFGFGFSF